MGNLMLMLILTAILSLIWVWACEPNSYYIVVVGAALARGHSND